MSCRFGWVLLFGLLLLAAVVDVSVNGVGEILRSFAEAFAVQVVR